ncbi:hypothetical protein C8Q77DRAFT_1074755 [Trametes polyzona]|nr:hypothetical protein C8Q77DRAFT_1074755 [Trametes polyzona]
MPPKNDIWRHFEDLKDAGGKTVKYLRDRSHSCAWCIACLDECVRECRAQDLVSIARGELREVRSESKLRSSFKNPTLALSAAGWKKPSNIVDDFTGVIPVCGKKDSASPLTIKISSRGTPVTKLSPLSLQSVLRQSAQHGSSPASSSSLPSTASATPYASPAKRARTLPDLTSLHPGQGAFDETKAAHALPAGLQELLESPCASCPCHHWDDNRQHELASDLCKLWVSCNIPWNAVSNPQLRIFMEKWIPGGEVPDRRDLAGKYLQEAVTSAVTATRSRVAGGLATGMSDGWKNIAKVPVLTSVMLVKNQPELIQMHNMAGLPKTGEQHAKIIQEDLDIMRNKFNVHPIAWVTDDGPDGKGARNLLRRLLPWLMTFVCWAHQSGLLAGDFLVFPEFKATVSAALDVVRWFNNHSSALDLFNQEQCLTYPDRPRPLVLILPALTRWTTHFQCASRLLEVGRALELCVARHRESLLQIGEKSQTAHAKETARKVIATIDDKEFWKRLDR